MKLKVFLFLLFLFFVIVHFFLPRFVVEINNPLLKVGRKLVGKKLPKKQDDHNSRIIEFKGQDGIICQAVLSSSDTVDHVATIILVHGIGGNFNQFNPVAKRLHQNGIQTVAVSLRAHRPSKGQFCTFGYKEKNDLASLIDQLQANKLCNENIGIWGISLGGAVSLHTLAHDKRIQFGIIESTFSNFKQIVGDYMQDYVPFACRVCADYFANRASSIADFDLHSVNPSEICGQINQPMLMIHGNRDTKIEIDYGRINYEALSSENKEFVEIEGAGHINVWEFGGDELQNRILTFILSHDP